LLNRRHTQKPIVLLFLLYAWVLMFDWHFNSGLWSNYYSILTNFPSNLLKTLFY